MSTSPRIGKYAVWGPLPPERAQKMLFCHARRLLHLSKAEAARAFGVHPSTITRWEQEGAPHHANLALVGYAFITRTPAAAQLVRERLKL